MYTILLGFYLRKQAVWSLHWMKNEAALLLSFWIIVNVFPTKKCNKDTLGNTSGRTFWHHCYVGPDLIGSRNELTSFIWIPNRGRHWFFFPNKRAIYAPSYLLRPVDSISPPLNIWWDQEFSLHHTHAPTFYVQKGTTITRTPYISGGEP